MAEAHSGWMTKQGGGWKSWKKRWFVLSGSSLIYKKTPESEELGNIDLRGKAATRADSEIKQRHALKIITPSRTWYMYCEGEEQIEKWLSAIREACTGGDSKQLAGDESLSEYRGWLTKRGGSIKTWKRRWCVLRGSHLYYYKSKDSNEPQGEIDVAGNQVRRMKQNEAAKELQKQNVIKIYCLARTWYLIADSSDEADTWVVMLSQGALLMVGQTHVVDVAGGTEGQAFKTVRAALEKAKSADRIVIHAGHYKESVTINKPLIIEGIGDVYISSSTKSPLTIATPTCRITNLKIRQVEKPDLPGINVQEGNIIIDHCEISASGGSCISATGESQIIVRGSQIHNGHQYGIYFGATSSGIIEHCEIVDNEYDGVMAMDNTSFRMSDCKILKNKYNGVSISCLGSTEVVQCQIMENSWDGITISSPHSKPNLFRNTIQNNQGYGIYVADGAAAGQILDNTISNNTKGDTRKKA